MIFLPNQMHPVFSILILLCVAQGLFLALVLFFKKENRPANRLLGWMCLAIALHLAEYAAAISGWTLQYPHLVAITYPLLFVMGPLFYVYARALLLPLFRWNWLERLHLLPALGCLLLFVPWYALPAETKVTMLKNLPKEGFIEIPPAQIAVMLTHIVQMSVYVVVAWRFLKKENARLLQTRSNGALIKLGWLTRATQVFAAFMFIYATVFAVMLFQKNYRVEMDYAVVLIMALLLYAIGFVAIAQPAILAESKPERRQLIPEGQQSGLRQRLIDCFEKEKMHLKEDLKLSDIAGRLKVPAHQLSEVLNGELGATFFDFVNEYRINEAKRMLADPAFGESKILAVAFDAGFGNKATFFRVFKKFTGMTPTEFRQKQLDS